MPQLEAAAATMIRRTVVAHGGERTVQSPNGQATENGVLPVSPRPGGIRRRILAVDDEPAILRLVTRALEERYAVRCAQSAAATRRLLQEGMPDLLILDVMLGEDSGLAVLSEFRRQSDAPVLLITGHGSEAMAIQALDLRANGYLPKPFSLQVLRGRVAMLLAEGPRLEHLAERARLLIEESSTAILSAGDLATRLGVKPRHLLIAFRTRFGRTPMQYLREFRLRQAKELLLSTNLPIATISQRVKFHEVSYFNRAFKLSVGCTPGEFRRTHILPAPPS
jgi:DNA-binding response OmpR family regulator